MANYAIKQIVYTGKDKCLSPYPSGGATGKLYPTNILGSTDAMGDIGSYGKAPYQQIILNGMYHSTGDASNPKKSVIGMDKNNRIFNENETYYLKLKIPRNANYDLDFALLLIPPFGEAADLDQLEYQLLRYIHVPKKTQKGIGENVVVLYERPKFFKLAEDGKTRIFTDSSGNYFSGEDRSVKGFDFLEEDIQVTIAYAPKKIDPSTNKPDSEEATSENMGKLFYTMDSNGAFLYWEVKEETKPDGKVERKWETAGDYYWYDERIVPIGKSSSVLAHSWISKDSLEYSVYDFIFKVRSSGMEYLYLYLIPNATDNDIAWIYNNEATGKVTQFYGRHVDIEKLEVECYKVSNLIAGDSTVRRMGLWGRSELMFSVNGEELRIPPSGYYELRDFPIQSIGVAAMDGRDQFTLDIQYDSAST